MAVISLHSNNSHILLNGDFLQAGDEALFERAEEQNHTTNQLGRGTAYFFSYDEHNMVLRHYRRGGLFRHFLRNQYLFAGWHNTRMWCEFHILLNLHNQALPVAVPLAARCIKTSPLTYTGSLVTATIEQAQTLATFLSQESLAHDAWRDLGQLLSRFHKAGADHADLNANNILLDRQGHFFVIDFDKGVLRNHAGRWQTDNLARLKRSLVKLSAIDDQPLRFTEQDWQALIAGYGPARPTVSVF